MMMRFPNVWGQKEGIHMANEHVNIEMFDEGGEATIAAMSEDSRLEIGRKTLCFVRGLMRNPELRALIKARAAEIRAAEGLN